MTLFLRPLRPFAINVRFARAGEAFIVFDARHARVSRFSKPVPPARAKRLQWKPALKPAAHERTCRAYLLFVTSWIDKVSSCEGNIYGIFVIRDM
jgi:hypothetical protein